MIDAEVASGDGGLDLEAAEVWGVEDESGSDDSIVSTLVRCLR